MFNMSSAYLVWSDYDT